MKQLLVFLAFPLFFQFISCSLEEPLSPDTSAMVMTRAAGPSARGQAGILIADHVQNFAFHAKISKDGAVSGSWESKSPSQDVRAHGEIICLMFDGSDTAYMVGVITGFTVGEDPVFFPTIGDQIWFKVIDNGEGNNHSPDLFSDWYWLGGNEIACNNFNVTMHEIVTGNIQVNP